MAVKKDKTITKSKNDICNLVLGQIEKRDIKMKPRRYFVFGSVLVGVGIGLLILAAAFLVNIKLYQLSIMRPFDWFSFGVSGIWPFILLFPWKVLLLALGVFTLGVYLVRMSTGTVHMRIITVAVTIAVVVMAGAVVLSRMNINRRLSQISMIGILYDHHSEGDNWLMGCVDKIASDGLAIHNFEGQTITVKLDQNRLDQPNPKWANNQIEMLGTWQPDGNFYAKNLRLVENDDCPI